MKMPFFIMLCVSLSGLQAMEKSSPSSTTFKRDTALKTEEIAIQIQGLVTKLAEQFSTPSSPYGFSSSTKVPSKKYKEIKDNEGNYSKKTYGIASTTIEHDWEKVRIIKSKKDGQNLYSFNIPFFEESEKVKIPSKIFDDNLNKNNLLRTFVDLIHQFQEQTHKLTEDDSLNKYKVAAKRCSADAIPSITGKVKLPESPTVSPNTSPISSPPDSPSKIKVAKTFMEKQFMVKSVQEKLQASFNAQDRIKEALKKS